MSCRGSHKHASTSSAPFRQRAEVPRPEGRVRLAVAWWMSGRRTAAGHVRALLAARAQPGVGPSAREERAGLQHRSQGPTRADGGSTTTGGSRLPHTGRGPSGPSTGPCPVTPPAAPEPAHRPAPWVCPAGAASASTRSQTPVASRSSSRSAARPWPRSSASSSSSCSPPPRPRSRAAWCPTTCCTPTACGRTSPGTGGGRPSCCSAPCTATRGCGRPVSPAGMPASERPPFSASRRPRGPGKPPSSTGCCSVPTACSIAWGAGWAPRPPRTAPALLSSGTSSGESPTTTSRWPSSRWACPRGRGAAAPGRE